MELEVINKLYLELSQVATAKTAKEVDLEKRLEERKLLGKLVQDIFNAGYQAALASQAQQPAFPPRDLTKPAEQQGMFSKFHVERVDGSSAKGGKHHGCRYWVLDLDHDKHAPAAMRGYAEDCKETHPILSAEIFAEFGMQSQAQQTESRWMIPTESQILAATEKAGLWPNTVYTWLPAFHRYHAELAKLPPAPEGEKNEQ